MTPRYACRVDGNHAEIVAEWRRLGLLFVSTHKQGDGAPDGYLLYRGIWLAIEFKTEKGKLKPKQVELHQRVRDKGGKIYIVRNLEDAMNLVGIEKAA
jgi:hypothetical protein